MRSQPVAIGELFGFSFDGGYFRSDFYNQPIDELKSITLDEITATIFVDTGFKTRSQFQKLGFILFQHS